ncbi:hypothetical protein R1flu_001552 [Riccia fluitans]|uniref:Uncharacterized protein n=1 Tax=Riccia fluitans TaxID=41844 RepID=A0ABD1Y6W7_9MARC
MAEALAIWKATWISSAPLRRLEPPVPHLLYFSHQILLDFVAISFLTFKLEFRFSCRSLGAEELGATAADREIGVSRFSCLASDR